MTDDASCAECSRYIEKVGGRWVARDDHEHAPAGGGAEVEGLTRQGQVLFVGGPAHGKVMTVGDDRGAWVVSDGPRDYESPPWLDRRTLYQRVRVCLEVDGVTRLRDVFTPGGQTPLEGVLREALMLAWFATGRVATLPSDANAAGWVGRARGGLVCCGSTGALHRWFCPVSSSQLLREPRPADREV